MAKHRLIMNRKQCSIGPEIEPPAVSDFRAALTASVSAEVVDPLSGRALPIRMRKTEWALPRGGVHIALLQRMLALSVMPQRRSYAELAWPLLKIQGAVSPSRLAEMVTIIDGEGFVTAISSPSK